jgi:predicted  nucleic acid-binding Zn-ribbon protein
MKKTWLVVIVFVVLFVAVFFQANARINKLTDVVNSVKVQTQSISALSVNDANSVTDLSLTVQNFDAKINGFSAKESADFSNNASQISDLQNKIGANSITLKQLQDSLVVAQSSLANLQKQTDTLSQQIVSVNSQSSTGQQTLQAIQDSVTNLGQQITQMQGQISGWQNSLANVSQRITTISLSGAQNSILFSSTPVPANVTTVLLSNFAPTKSGYVYISSQTNNLTGTINVLDSQGTGGYYPLGTTFNVTTGHSYSISFTSTIALDGQVSGSFYPY